LSVTIDAHHHLWRYTTEDYGWIDDTMSAIRRDFIPEDISAAMVEAGIDGAVAVQARQSLEETRWLLDLAENSDEIRGVVGWAPLASEDFVAVMGEFADRKKLRGLRHILQGEADGYMLGHQFNAGVDCLQGLDLVYDVLVYERQLAEAIQFVDRHPQQIFVLDHIAKPRIRDGALEPWAAQMRELGRRSNVWCKVSGLVTEANWESWTSTELKPYLDVVVEAFGPARLMAGSDWPVCLLASSYSRWFAVLKEYFAAFSRDEQQSVFGATAAQVYKLSL
jgi:L-fuconolactonase